MKRLRRFLEDSGAAVALLFGIALLPVGGLAGVAVDYAAARSVQRHLQATVDAAALVGATVLNERPDVIRQRVADSFGTNVAGVPFDLTPQNPRITPGDDRVTVEAEIAVPTTLSRLLGVREMRVMARAVAGASGVSPLEIVFTIDITESMGFHGSWDIAVTEMDRMLTDLSRMAARGDDVVMGLVPFSDRVNVGVARGTAWINARPPRGYSGCLDPREEPEPRNGFPHMETNTPPSRRGFRATRPADFGIFRTLRGFRLSLPGCLPSPIVGPTTRTVDIRTALNTASKGGTGRPEQGLLWAWRMLSPDWEPHWGMPGFPSPHGEKRKVIGMIVDGQSEAYYWEMGGRNGRPPRGEPYVFNSPTTLSLEHLAEICRRVKADGIEIHVLYVNGDVRAEPYYRACATDPDSMYSATNMQSLIDAFGTMKSSMLGGGHPHLIE